MITAERCACQQLAAAGRGELAACPPLQEASAGRLEACYLPGQLPLRPLLGPGPRLSLPVGPPDRRAPR